MDRRRPNAGWRRTRTALGEWLGVFFLVSACSIAFQACEKEPVRTESSAPQVRVPQQVLDNAEMRQSSLKGLLWILNADRALNYEDTEETDLHGLKIDFYDGTDHVRSTLTSLRGAVDSASSVFTAIDSVVVVTAEGDRLETDYLEWDPKTERVKTPRPFRLFTGSDEMTGVGIDADPDLRHYSVHSDLRVIVRDAHDLEDRQ